MKKLRLTILQGLPASGKSTYAKKLVETQPNTKRINKDDLRQMLDDRVFNKNNERFIIKVRDAIVKEALSNNYNVVVDDTNLAKYHIDRLREIAEEYNAKVDIVFINTPLEDCIQRDLQRFNSVGERVIKDMYYKYLYQPPIPPNYDENLPDCYMVDIDGTLAIAGDRSPFDWHRVGEDLPNLPVIKAVWQHAQHTPIIILSGRKECCRVETTHWLKQHLNFDYVALYMRSDGDDRGDDIVKQEIYQQNIANKYNVIGIYDDRPRVCRMWRKLGLPVFQVTDPDIEF